MSAERRRLAIALLLLVPLLAVIACLTPGMTWHSAPSCDARTHIEMIRGVSEHGLPYHTNGPLEEFPELQARWNLVRGGKLWGNYPPLFAYVATPFFRIGGLPMVARANFALLALFVLGVFALGARYLKDPLCGVAAAYLVVLTTPASAAAIDMSPYLLTYVLLVWAAYVALVSASLRGAIAAGLALLAGALAGLSVTAHLMAFPMAVGLLGAMLLRNDGDPIFRRPILERFVAWLPSRSSVRAAIVAGVGFVAILTPLGYLNYLRFGSPNPISYGPCVWRDCWKSNVNQNVSSMVLFAAPTLVWLIALLGILWYFRGRRIPQAVALVAFLAALIPETPLGLHTGALWKIGYGYIVDNSHINLELIERFPDGLGSHLGPFVLRSTLQCTPALALAVLAPFATPKERQSTLLLGLPVLLLYVMCTMRANLPPVDAFGFPFIFLRYIEPAAAFLCILAVGAVRKLPWQPWHVGMTLVFGLAFYACLAQWPDDGPYVRRLLLLYFTLFTGAVALAAVFWARRRPAGLAPHVAVFAVAAAIGASLGNNTEVTLPGVAGMRQGGERRVARVGAVLPQRLAIVGFGAEIDTVLTLRATRDLEYADLYEWRRLDTVRRVIDHWMREDRPVYLFWYPRDDAPPLWPDLVFDPVIREEGLYRVRVKQP